MSLEIGKMIRKLRLQWNMTQEELAQRLGVTSQAVSKWENNTSTPDIALLPELAILFGTTIDELFELTEESHLERIHRMLLDDQALSEEDFHYSVSYLTARIRSSEACAQYHGLLAEVYNRRAKDFRLQAKSQAERALELCPEEKAYHNALSDATDGLVFDWYISNHHQQIAYYQRFISLHPESERGHLRLLALLLADGRTEEARKVLESLEKLAPSCRCPFYRGRILQAEGRLKGALEIWQGMLESYPEDWLAFGLYGDCMAYLCRYEEAITAYQKAQALQPSPKYLDYQESIAHIEEIRGNPKQATEAYRRELALLGEEWHVTEGGKIEEIQRQIWRLEQVQ